MSEDITKLIDYEHKIYKEFQCYDHETYTKHRVEFLRKEASELNNNYLNILADYVEKRRPNIGLYAGSFNPFHVGHLDILTKAEKIFDKVILDKGANPEKDANNSKLPDCVSNREIIIWAGLTPELIKKLSIHSNVTLIRGLRSGKDLDYEVNNLRYMEDAYEDIKVIFIHCDRNYEHISSRDIKMLEKFGSKLIKKYLKQ